MSEEAIQPLPGDSPPKPPLGYDPTEFPRELARHYVPASEEDVRQMLETIGEETLDDLFAHVPPEVRFPEPPD